MADYVDVHVEGLRELQRSLAAFGSDRIVGKIIRASLQAGARLVRPRSVSNARALGLGFRGIQREKRGSGSMREVKHYGRIPRAIKVGRAYIPGNDKDAYRVNVIARGQRQRGIFPNKAPHAHLIEYGWRHRGGQVIAGRPFHGPALSATAAQVVEKIRTTMAKRIEAEGSIT